jgi:hypothetical protein
MTGRDNDDIDDKYGGRGSETGSGNDAHRSPGESGQAEGAGYSRTPTRTTLAPSPKGPRPVPADAAARRTRSSG